MSWQDQKRWSDRFLPEIKSILGMHLMAEPPREEDAERNTDLMVLRMDAVRIGCRVRKYKYLDRYADEFTIRAQSKFGNKTEITKIIEGWGDYFFYGFCDAQEKKLSQWALCDLKVFRLWFGRETYRLPGKAMPGVTMPNADGTKLQAFKFSDLPPEFVIAGRQALEGAA